MSNQKKHNNQNTEPACNQCPQCKMFVSDSDAINNNFKQQEGARHTNIQQDDQAEYAESQDHQIVKIALYGDQSQTQGLCSQCSNRKRNRHQNEQVEEDANDFDSINLEEQSYEQIAHEGLFEQDGNADLEYQQIQEEFEQIRSKVLEETRHYQNRQRLITQLSQQSSSRDILAQEVMSDIDHNNVESDVEVPEEGLVDRSNNSLTSSLIEQKQRREQTQNDEEFEIPVQNPKKAVENQKCRIHKQNKIQAFCEDCKKLMCISCILDKAHKGHEMVDIPSASNTQKSNFAKGILTAKSNKIELQNQILMIKNHICDIEVKAQQYRYKIDKVFNEIKQKIMNREQFLKKRLSEILDTEQSIYKQQIENLKEKIRHIKDMEQEQTKLSRESDFTILQKCKTRQEILADAMTMPDMNQLLNCIPKLSKEEELAFIVNILLPKKFRAKILSHKLSSYAERAQNSVGRKRFEFQNNMKDGSVGSGSQSSLITGQVISFPSGRLASSNSVLQNHCLKDKVTKIKKIELDNLNNGHQISVNLKNIDNNKGQKSRNDQPHKIGLRKNRLYLNMSPRQTKHLREQKTKIQPHRSREKTSPAITNAIAISLVGQVAAEQDTNNNNNNNHEPNRSSNSFDNFWSLSNQRIQNQIMRFSLGNRRGINGSIVGNPKNVNLSSKTKRANTQTTGKSICVVPVNEQNEEDVTCKEQDASSNRHVGSDFGSDHHHKKSMEVNHQNPLTQRATRTIEKNDEKESMKTLKRNQSPVDPNAGLGQTVDHFGLAGNLSFLNSNECNGVRFQPVQIQKFKYNDKTIEDIDQNKQQQQSIELVDSSLLQRIVENDGGAMEPSSQHNLLINQKHTRKNSYQNLQQKPCKSDSRHRNSNKKAMKDRTQGQNVTSKTNKSIQGLASFDGSLEANVPKAKPKTRKAHPFNHNFVNALTERNSKVQPESSILKIEQRKFNKKDLEKILNDTIKQYNKHNRKNSSLSGTQKTIVSQASPSVPQAQQDTYRLTNKQFQHHDKANSQNRYQQKRTKAGQKQKQEEAYLAECPTSLINLESQNENHTDSLSRSNMNKTTKEQPRSMSHSRKNWKEKSNSSHKVHINSIERDKYRISNTFDDTDTNERFAAEKLPSSQRNHLQMDANQMMIASKPSLILETYYKKQNDYFQHVQGSNQVSHDHDNLPPQNQYDSKQVHRQNRQPSQCSSSSADPNEKEQRSKLKMQQRKQWPKATGKQQRSSDTNLIECDDQHKSPQIDSFSQNKPLERNAKTKCSNQRRSEGLKTNAQQKEPNTHANSSNTSLYQQILDQNKATKQTSYLQNNNVLQDSASKRKPAQTNQTAKASLRNSNTIKAKQTNPKTDNNLDEDGCILKENSGKLSSGAFAKQQVQDSQQDLQQRTQGRHEHFPNGENTLQSTSPSQLCVNKNEKDGNKTKIVGSKIQISNSPSQLQSHRKKKRAMKRTKREVRNVIKNVTKIQQTKQKAIHMHSREKSQNSAQMKLDNLREQIHNGNLQKYQTLEQPESARDNEGMINNQFGRQKHGINGFEDNQTSELDIDEAEDADREVNRQTKVTHDRGAERSDGGEGASMGDKEFEANSEPRSSDNRHQLEDRTRQLRPEKFDIDIGQIYQLQTAAAKCQSPEPFYQIERLRRFDLTTPKKNLRELDSAKILPVDRSNTILSHKKVESQKIGMIGLSKENDIVDEFVETEQDQPHQETANQRLSKEIFQMDQAVCKKIIDKDSLPYQQVHKQMLESNRKSKWFQQINEVIIQSDKEQIEKFENKFRSRSSQVQECPLPCNDLESNKRNSTINLKQDNLKLTENLRSISDRSSCDFRVDDDERYYGEDKRIDIQGVQSMTETRRWKMSINSSSYSVALMQSRKNQKKKINYENNPTNPTKIDSHNEKSTPNDNPNNKELKTDPSISAHQLIKKSIKKKVIQELGYEQERHELPKPEPAKAATIHGAQSNRSIVKPILKLAEPTRAQSPLSINSNISSSHSSKYKSVRIQQKKFDGKANNQALSKIDHIVSPAIRSKAKKKGVKSFDNGSETISQASNHFSQKQNEGYKSNLENLRCLSPGAISQQMKNIQVLNKEANHTLQDYPSQSQQNLLTNPVAAAIAEVKLHQHLKDSGANKFFDKTQNQVDQSRSSKKRQRKIRQLDSVPSIQARSHSSFPCEGITPRPLLDQVSCDKNDQLPLITNQQTDEARLSTIGPDFASSIVSANAQGLVLSQSKSDLYRVNEEFFFIFGGANDSNSNGTNQQQLNGESNQSNRLFIQPQSVEVMDVTREICRDFRTTQNDEFGILNKKDQQDQLVQEQNCKQQSLVPFTGFKAIRFNIDKAFAKKHKITKFDDRIFLVGGKDESDTIIDKVFEYSINEMQTLFIADWKLQHALVNFSVTQGKIKRTDLSDSIFIAGGITNRQLDSRYPVSIVQRLFLAKQDEQFESQEYCLLGTDMTTSFKYMCQNLPDMKMQRTQFCTIFRNLDKQDFELYAIGGIDFCENLQKKTMYAIEKYSSQTGSWEEIELLKEDTETDDENLRSTIEYLSHLRGHQAILMPDGSIYIIGGAIPQFKSKQSSSGDLTCSLVYQNKVLRFDTNTRILSQCDLPPMNLPRGFFTAHLTQNLRYIYVIGGNSNIQNSNINKKVSIESNQAKTKCEMPLDSIEKFDTFNQKWSFVAPMKSKRANHSVCQVFI